MKLAPTAITLAIFYKKFSKNTWPKIQAVRSYPKLSDTSPSDGKSYKHFKIENFILFSFRPTQ